MKKMKPSRPDVMRPAWDWPRGTRSSQVADAAPTRAMFTIKAKGSGVIPAPEAQGSGIVDREPGPMGIGFILKR
jgi:hypothetical protein